MTQQVILARTKLPSLIKASEYSSFDTTWEQLGTSTSVNQATVAAKLTAFFNTVATGAAQAMGSYISDTVSRAANACLIEMYDVTDHLNGSPAGSPVSQYTFTMINPYVSTSPAPEGIAAMIGYQSDYGGDTEFAPGSRPRSRHRSRVYLGPLLGSMYSYDPTTKRCLWSTGFKADLGYQWDVLVSAAGTTDVTGMVQWSRKNAAVNHISYSWVDDAPRYQRRREPLSGVRLYM